LTLLGDAFARPVVIVDGEPSASPAKTPLGSTVRIADSQRRQRPGRLSADFADFTDWEEDIQVLSWLAKDQEFPFFCRPSFCQQETLPALGRRIEGGI